MRGSLAAWIVPVVALALAGCATPPPVQSPAEFSKTHGFVHLTLPKAGPGGRPTIRSVTDKQDFALAPMPSDPLAYGRWVPPGEYTLTGWQPSNAAPLPFPVKAGAVTDLGSLVSVSIGTYGIVILPVRHAEEEQRMQRSIAAFKAQVAPEAITWNVAKPPAPLTPYTPASGLGLVVDMIAAYVEYSNSVPIKERLKNAATVEEFLRVLKEITPPLSQHAAVLGERLYFRADFGQVRVRDEQGRWGSLDTGTLQRISAVAAAPGWLIAGSEDGVIRASRDEGRTWTKVATVAPGESVIDIDRVGSRWLVLAAIGAPGGVPNTVLTKRLKVYSAAREDFADLGSVGEFPMNDIQFAFLMGSGAGYPARNVYFVNAYPDVHRLDLATMQWKKLAAPGTVHEIHVSDSGLLTVFRNQGMFSKLHVSADAGDSWKELDTPPYPAESVRMETPSAGRATRFSVGVVTSGLETMRYDPAANRWVKVLEAPEGCARSLWDATNVPVFCVTRGGSILRHNGTKWIAEFAAE